MSDVLSLRGAALLALALVLSCGTGGSARADDPRPPSEGGADAAAGTTLDQAALVEREQRLLAQFRDLEKTFLKIGRAHV